MCFGNGKPLLEHLHSRSFFVLGQISRSGCDSELMVGTKADDLDPIGNYILTKILRSRYPYSRSRWMTKSTLIKSKWEESFSKECFPSVSSSLFCGTKWRFTKWYDFTLSRLKRQRRTCPAKEYFWESFLMYLFIHPLPFFRNWELHLLPSWET